MNQTLSLPAKPITLISIKKLTFLLLLFTAVVVLASIIADYFRFLHPNDVATVKLYLFFDLNQENNLPTLYSTFLLFTAAVLNFLIYSICHTVWSNSSTYWLILGIVFTYLGLDEQLQLHDRLNRFVVKDNFAGGDFFHYFWVIPYGVGVIVLGLFFLRFMLNLPKKTRNSFILAGVIFVGGALGFEFIESYVYVHFGFYNIYMFTLTTIEETMEMVGVIIFIDALLKYISSLKARVILK